MARASERVLRKWHANTACKRLSGHSSAEHVSPLHKSTSHLMTSSTAQDHGLRSLVCHFTETRPVTGSKLTRY